MNKWPPYGITERFFLPISKLNIIFTEYGACFGIHLLPFESLAGKSFLNSSHSLVESSYIWGQQTELARKILSQQRAKFKMYKKTSDRIACHVARIRRRNLQNTKPALCYCYVIRECLTKQYVIVNKLYIGLWFSGPYSTVQSCRLLLMCCRKRCQHLQDRLRGVTAEKTVNQTFTAQSRKWRAILYVCPRLLIEPTSTSVCPLCPQLQTCHREVTSARPSH
jgi:hypothetical protein